MDPSTKLCMGCMNELGSDGRCHYCSYTDRLILHREQCLTTDI